MIDSSEQARKYELDDFILEEQGHRTRKNQLISDLVQQKKISVQYASLLNAIQTSTFGKEGPTLRKVESSFAMKNLLRDIGISEKKTLYIGSNTDWQFPASLGVRDLVMLDLEFNSNTIKQIIDSLIQFDQSPDISGDFSHLTFNLDVGNGIETMRLQFITDDVNTYQPTVPLGCIMEFAGPSKGYNRNSTPLLPNIADSVTNDAIILNFDYHTQVPSSDIGLDKIELPDGMILYQVADKTLLTKAANQRQHP